jgi:hypothetical protein
MFGILDLMANAPTLKIIDVGAMSLGQGTDPYFRLMQLGVASVIGFKPMKAECSKLNCGIRWQAHLSPLLHR